MNNPNSDSSDYTGFIFDGSHPIVSGQESHPRKCRFCGLAEPSTTFENDTAHAVSESLGNINFICYDECKPCNHYFSNIEQGFYRAHAPMLMMCGIGGKDNGKRKNNIKSVSGADCKISLSEKGFFIAVKDVQYEQFQAEAKDTHAFNYNPILKFEKFKLIDVYKSLCKYVISLLPNNLLPQFEQTIEWLRGKRTILNLPHVVTTITPLTTHPIVGYLIRQSENTNPYAIGFFRFAMVTYLFIIPGANNEFDYPSEEWLLSLANTLHQGHSTWYAKDLNSNEKITPKLPIEIKGIELGTNCFEGSKEQFGL